MAEDITISNSYMAYISNNPYQYPSDEKNQINVMDSNTLQGYSTGWHVIPTMLWKHFCTPKSWFEMQINYEAVCVTGYKVTVFNMVPLTAQLAIQGNNIFYAFNNTIYAIGYQDKLYETNWYNYYGDSATGAKAFDWNLLYKEGLVFPSGTNSARTRLMLPTYIYQPTATRTQELWTWNMQFFRTANVNLTGVTDNQEWYVDGVYPGEAYKPTGLLWDPLTRPDEIMELRPGKNAISYSWQVHECDSGKWFNLDEIAAWYPYTASGPYNMGRQRPYEWKLTGIMDPDRQANREQYKPGNGASAGSSGAPWGKVYDYTIPNWSDLPIVPNTWWWKEMQNSILPVGSITNTQNKYQEIMLKYLNMFFNGTEREQHHYPPEQCFIKLLPIFNSENTIIECSAQVCVKTQLFLKCKKRRSAIYCPTWGPIPWRSVYSARTSDRNFFPAHIRYRTGGMRRSWQNLGDSGDLKSHPRKTPYNTTSANDPGDGQGGTYSYEGRKRPMKSTTRVSPSAPPMEIDPGAI